VVRANVTSGWR